MHEEGAALGSPLVVLGGLLLAGFIAHVAGSKAHVPRVTLLLIIGLLAGPDVLNVVPESLTQWFPATAQLALSMIGFGLGEQFLGKRLRNTGRQVLIIALFESCMAALVTGLALFMLGMPSELCLLLAGIAPSTAPAATVDVIREARAKGPVTDTVLSVAAIDDAIGIILFGLLMAAAQATSGGDQARSLLHAAWEVGGSVGLGLLVGVPMAWLTGRARPGTLTLIEALAFVFIASGLAVSLNLSYLLTNIVLGATVANLARHHTRPFHAISGVTQPLVVLFFLLAGFGLDLDSLPRLGLVGLTYAMARSVGKLLGARWGAQLSGTPTTVVRFAGVCLLPQAGVAIGLALMAAEQVGGRFDLLGLVVGTTFIFEVVGPLATRWALSKAGELGRS